MNTPRGHTRVPWPLEPTLVDNGKHFHTSANHTLSAACKTLKSCAWEGSPNVLLLPRERKRMSAKSDTNSQGAGLSWTRIELRASQGRLRDKDEVLGRSSLVPLCIHMHGPLCWLPLTDSGVPANLGG